MGVSMRALLLPKYHRMAASTRHRLLQYIPNNRPGKAPPLQEGSHLLAERLFVQAQDGQAKIVSAVSHTGFVEGESAMEKISVEQRAEVHHRFRASKLGAGRTSYLSVAKGFSRRVATLLCARRYDLVLVYGELLPYLPRWFERWCSSSRIPYVVDVDDAFFLQYGNQAHPLVRWLCGEKFRQVFGDATLVMAGN